LSRIGFLVASTAAAAVALGGCGSDDSSSITQGTAPTAQTEPATTGQDTTQTPAGSEMTDAQREKARDRARTLADCLREAGATADTESTAVTDPAIRSAGGPTLHLVLRGGEADLVVLATPADARTLASSLGDDVTVVRKGRTVVAFAKKPGGGGLRTLRSCL
jgi:hypothetical protein